MVVSDQLPANWIAEAVPESGPDSKPSPQSPEAQALSVVVTRLQDILESLTQAEHLGAFSPSNRETGSAFAEIERACAQVANLVMRMPNKKEAGTYALEYLCQVINYRIEMLCGERHARQGGLVEAPALAIQDETSR